MKRTFTLLLGFLISPVLVVSFIWITEWMRTGGFNISRFLHNVSITLAGYAVGSIVPFIHEEFRDSRLATVSTNKGTASLEKTEEQKDAYQFAKMIVLWCFVLGLVIWIANLTLLDLPNTPPITVQKWLQLLAGAYFVATGSLQIYIRNSGKNAPEAAAQSAGKQV
jgi:hypothetical protein